MPKRRDLKTSNGDARIGFLKKSDPDAEKDIDFNLWILLNQSRDSVFRAREDELSKYGVTTREADALFHIMNNDNVTPAEVSRILFREHTTVSALLVRMEKKGLIVRVRDKERKNIWRIKITEKGRNAYLNSVKRESLRIIMSSLSIDEKQQIVSFLKKIRDNAFLQLISTPSVPYP